MCVVILSESLTKWLIVLHFITTVYVHIHTVLQTTHVDTNTFFRFDRSMRTFALHWWFDRHAHTCAQPHVHPHVHPQRQPHVHPQCHQRSLQVSGSDQWVARYAQVRHFKLTLLSYVTITHPEIYSKCRRSPMVYNCYKAFLNCTVTNWEVHRYLACTSPSPPPR